MICDSGSQITPFGYNLSPIHKLIYTILRVSPAQCYDTYINLPSCVTTQLFICVKTQSKLWLEQHVYVHYENHLIVIRVTSWLSAKPLLILSPLSSSVWFPPGAIDVAGYDNWDFRRLAGNLGYRTARSLITHFPSRDAAPVPLPWVTTWSGPVPLIRRPRHAVSPSSVSPGA